MKIISSKAEHQVSLIHDAVLDADNACERDDIRDLAAHLKEIRIMVETLQKQLGAV